VNTRAFLSAGALIGALLLAPAPVAAVSVSTVASDVELVSLLGGTGEPLLDWVTQGRIGNNATNGDVELDIGTSTSGGGVADAENLQWNPAAQANLLLQYEAATGLATTTITQSAPGTNAAVSFTVPVGRRDASALFIRLQRPGSFLTSTDIDLLDLTVDDAAPGSNNLGTFSFASGSGKSIWQVQGLDFTGDFTLSAGLSMVFDPADVGFGAGQFRGSALAFQLKFGNPVPVPAAVWLLGSALAALGARARRRGA